MTWYVYYVRIVRVAFFLLAPWIAYSLSLTHSHIFYYMDI